MNNLGWIPSGEVRAVDLRSGEDSRMFGESGWDRREVGWGDELDDPEYWNPDSGYAETDPELVRLLDDVPPHHDGPGPDVFRR